MFADGRCPAVLPIQVRLLSEQLRDAQNHIAAKDRAGAWRSPNEIAEMHVSDAGAWMHGAGALA